MANHLASLNTCTGAQRAPGQVMQVSRSCNSLLDCNHGGCVPEDTSLGHRCSILLLSSIVIRKWHNLLNIGTFHYCALGGLPYTVAARLTLREAPDVACAIRECPCALDDLSFLPIPFELILRVCVDICALTMSL